MYLFEGFCGIILYFRGFYFTHATVKRRFQIRTDFGIKINPNNELVPKLVVAFFVHYCHILCLWFEKFCLNFSYNSLYSFGSLTKS